MPALKELKISARQKKYRIHDRWTLRFLSEEYIPIKFDEVVNKQILWNLDQEDMGS